MANGAPIFCGISAGSGPVLQPGSRFSNRTYGLDDGSRTFLSGPFASRASWPKVGDGDRENSGMYVVDVTPRDDPSSMIELSVQYRGVAGGKPDRITPDCDVQLLTLPVSSYGTDGGAGNLLLPMPQPRVSREYVTSTKPTLAGVGIPVVADWLPQAPTFSLTFVPDPSKPPTLNYYGNRWVLQNRSWQEIIPGKLWFVQELAVYYFSLASA